MKTLSLVIPCYNEAKTLSEIVDKSRGLGSENLQIELIIVDDCSKDGSRDIIQQLARRYPQIKALYHEKNSGKGAALRTGFLAASGDYVGIQDADLEYNPADYLQLLEAMEKTSSDAVYGSRYLVRSPRTVGRFFHTLMNKFLTTISNIFTDLDLTDMETCYKLFRREVIQQIAPSLKENRFGFEPEITALLAQGKYSVAECSINYAPRSYEEGKKITWLDGVRALYCIVRYNAFRAPAVLQVPIYFVIGLLSAIIDIVVFAILNSKGAPLFISVGVAYVLAAAFNYLLCIKILFRNHFCVKELAKYCATFILMWLIDYFVTWGLIELGINPVVAKALSIILGFFGNFSLRKFWVFNNGC